MVNRSILHHIGHLIRISSMLMLSTVLFGCDLETQTPAPSSTDALPTLTVPAELVSLQTLTIGPPSIRRMWTYK